MYPLLPHHVAQHILSEYDIGEMALEHARLKARVSDVDPLTDEDRKALDELLSLVEIHTELLLISNLFSPG